MPGFAHELLALVSAWVTARTPEGRWAVRALYALTFFGTLWTIHGWSGAGGSGWWKWAIPISLAGSLVAEWMHAAISAMTTALMTGTASTERRPDPPLSKAKSLMEREEFDDALVELDLVWAKFPGRHEVLACYERILVDRMAGPSAFAEFLEGALPKMEAVDRPYAYLRLAELHADRIGNRELGFLWTSRLLAEFPDSRHVPAARALRESLKPKET